MAGELLSKGTVIKVGDGADPEVFTTITGATGFTVPAEISDEIEVTDLESEAKEYIAGLGDAGEFSFQLNLKRKATGSGYIAIQETLESYAGDGELHNFQIVLPAPFSVTYAFAAFVKAFQPNAQVNSALTATVTLRVSGAVTRSPV